MADESAAIARVRALADKWIAVPTAGVYGPDINSYGRAVHAVLDEPEMQEKTMATSRKTGAIGVGMPAVLHLNAFGREVREAFGEFPYLVGSAAVGKGWRDVDVRLMLADEEFDALFPEHVNPGRCDGRWSLLCAAISELGRMRTGLPIDFQIQRTSEANERYGGEVRQALGLYLKAG